MKFNEYINHNIDIENAYQNFKKAKDIDFKRDINKNENKRKIYSFKMFKLSIIILIFILLIVFITTSRNMNYREIEMDEDFKNFHYMLQEESPFLNFDYFNGNEKFIQKNAGLIKAKIMDNYYYIVGYVNKEIEEGNIDNKITIKWYKYKSDKISYEMDGYIVKYVIRAFKIQYTKDITTGYCFNIKREYYSACKFEKYNDENSEYINVLGDVQEFYKYMNKEFLEKWPNTQIRNDEDLRKWKETNTEKEKISHFLKLYNFSDYILNNYYYNLITLNNKQYVGLYLYKVEGGEKIKYNFLEECGNIGEELIKIQSGEIYSEDNNYIIGLYPLNEVEEIVLRANKDR